MNADVVIIGAGPAGSATSLFLEQQGIQSTIIEKATFPRFHIGESMTSECGKTVRTLGLEDEMIRRKHFVKRGVSVFSPTGKDAFRIPIMDRDENGLQPYSTWHVQRSDFDKMLLDTAVERGATIVRGEVLAPCLDDGTLRGVTVRTATGEIEKISAKVVVDASGQSTFLSRVEIAGKKKRGNYTNQIAIFSHMVGADYSGPASDQTLIFYQKQHHWGWFIPLNDEVVSVGVVVPAPYFAASEESRRDFFVRESRNLNPRLAEHIAEATLIGDVRAVSNYSYHIEQFVGDGFLCVGDSHRFIDPIFSFGMHFGLSEAQMAAQAIAAHFGNPNHPNPFAAYQARAEAGQDVIQTLIDAFWNHPLGFGYLAHVEYIEDMIDFFAGRVYLDAPAPGLLAMQSLANKKE